MLSEKVRSSILELQKSYPEPRSALIPALHLAQQEKGYLPEEIQKEVAELFNIDLNEVNAVVTFYDMFFDKPCGKHIIHVCKNVSCMLHGSDDILEKLCHKLNIQPKETTQDGEITVIPSECLAACDLAPMMLIDDQVFGSVQEKDLDELLQELKKSPGHPSPIKILENDHA